MTAMAGPLHLVGRWRSALRAEVDHEEVADRIRAESGWSPRFAFTTLMSAGIAVLGLLLSSPAVVIGAMLISPLMHPIIGLGFGLALFDFREMRRALGALAIAAVLAVAFTALIVLLSPLKAATPEIVARTRPNLFDLLVALFAALAGAFAVIRGRGDTVVGVAIATALMPPLATVGYGAATGNLPVLAGAAALFGTNFVTIALSAAIVARWYGFGSRLSPRQSWAQTATLFLVFALMTGPLAVALGHIAEEALAVSRARSYLAGRFGPDARITQLDVDFKRDPVAVRAVVIAAQARAVPNAVLAQGLRETLDRPLSVQVAQVLLDPQAGAIQRQRAELLAAEHAQADPAGDEAAVQRLLSLAAGRPDAVFLDRDRHAASVAADLPGAGLATYRALEERLRTAVPGWQVELVPPPLPLPHIDFVRGADTLDETGTAGVTLAAWAAARWHARALAVAGLTPTTPTRPTLMQRRATAVARALGKAGVMAEPAPAPGLGGPILSILPRDGAATGGTS